jgi:hypothetical protein
MTTADSARLGGSDSDSYGGTLIMFMLNASATPWASVCPAAPTPRAAVTGTPGPGLIMRSCHDDSLPDGCPASGLGAGWLAWGLGLGATR